MSLATGPTTPRPRSSARWQLTLGALLAAALAITLALGPATREARADAYLGSTLLLRHTPDATEPVAVDSLFWLTALASDTLNVRRYLVTQPGQIVQFQVRGYTAGAAPATIHFQDLRPNPSGALQIVASSGAYPLPTTDGIWSFDPENFCVQAGDYLGFNEGGGSPVDVFASVPGSTTQRFSSNFGTNNGDLVMPTALTNVELLMAAYEGTGPHANPLCGGIAGSELHVTAHSIAVGAAGGASVPLACTGPLPCSGSLTVIATVKPRHGHARTVAVAQTQFALGSHASGAPTVTIDAAGRSLLRTHHGSLPVTIAAALGNGGPADTLSATATLTG